MDSEQLGQVAILAVLVGGVVLVVQAVAQALVRYRALREGVDPATYAAVLDNERRHRRDAALRWGLVALGLGAALLALHWLQWPANSAGAMALPALGAGAGLLLFFGLNRGR